MKKFIAPLISAVFAAVVMIAFGCLYVAVFLKIPDLKWLAVLFAAGALAGIAVLIAVLVQRYKELKRGEEDDLSEY